MSSSLLRAPSISSKAHHAPKQLELQIKPRRTHGGRRKGAGRPNRTGLQAHLRRPKIDSWHPVHVTLKLQPGLPSLRRKETFRCLRAAVKTARRRGLHVTQFAILSNHVHLILEIQHQKPGALLQSLAISFAKRLNALLTRTGAVFRGRYHLHILKTPTEVRRALAYVLSNDSHHRHSRSLDIPVDPFSSAWAFEEWKTLFGARANFETTNWTETYLEAWLAEILSPPRTWLLKVGWMRGVC